MKAPAWISAAALLAAAALAEELQIQAASMSSGDDVTEFRGDVRVSGDEIEIEAETLSIDSAAELLDLSGTPALISLMRITVTVTISAHRVEYDQAADQASLRGDASIERGALRVRADLMDYSGEAGSLVARDSVLVSEDDLEAGAAMAEVSGLEGDSYEMRLEGAPATLRVRRKEGFFVGRASVIDYSQGDDQVILRGDAVAEYGEETISGEELVYRLDSGIFTASPSGDGRVTAIISLP